MPTLECFSCSILWMHTYCIYYVFSSMQLLGHEVHAREQVPLLMEMKKADMALDKAIESGDPQLGKLSA